MDKYNKIEIRKSYRYSKLNSIINWLSSIWLLDKNTFFSDATIVGNGIIQIESLNQKNAGNVTIRFLLRIQRNLLGFAQ